MADRLLRALLAVLTLVATAASLPAAENAPLEGTLRDAAGAPLPGASLHVQDDQRRDVASTSTDGQGRFRLAVPPGRYALLVEAPGFVRHRQPLVLAAAGLRDLDVTLQPLAFSEKVTVTATPGVIQSVEDSPQPVNVIGEELIGERARSVIAQIVEGEPGLHLQRTSPTMSGIYVRGLTGNKVSVFVDGVRFSTASARGGVNTFMNLNDPAAMETVEVLRGPSSAQYGSDAIGGSVQYLLRQPAFASSGRETSGAFASHFDSADLGFGSELTGRYATSDLAVQGTLEGRRVSTLRPGDGIDSHNAVTRFLGLPSSVAIDDRLPDTAFTQYGGSFKGVWTPSSRDELVASYVRSQQDGGKRYDQLLGGDGNLVADLRNLMLDLGYLRFSRQQAGPFDRVSLGYSFNAQREERVNQGGNGNPRANVNHEYEKTRVHGTQALLTRLAGAHALSLGGDYYWERVTAPSFSENPVSGAVSVRRGRVPDGARFQQGGLFLQDVFSTLSGKLDVVGSLRWSHASYQARAADSPLVGGEPLWPDDSLTVDRLTYRAGLAWRTRPDLTLTFNVSTGFRAPHVTDLGTLGLTGAGFEVSSDSVAGRGATVGTSAASSAVSSGLPVEQQKPEFSQVLEGSIRYHRERFDTDLFVFVNDVDDNITKQALILPAGAVGSSLGDELITAQTPAGVVFVPASASPVLVRSNFDDARVWGIEHTLNVRLTDAFSLATVATYLHAEDKRTEAPPNIEGGTPALEGWLRLRWAPAGRRYWVEPYLRLVARNDRLSTLDLEDRRSGAPRSRSSIASFFTNGARARGLVSAGPDGVAGNADDVLLATGETLAQVQARVLGSASSTPLFGEIPGYATVGVRGGLRIGARHHVYVDLINLGDVNYRGVSWGLDAPGRSLYVRYRVTL